MRRYDIDIGDNIAKSRDSNYSGSVSSTGDGGKVANIDNMSGSQLRNCKIVSPYGVSSCPTPGVKAQVIVNGNNEPIVAGVFDAGKPKANPGEIVLYSSGGASIILRNNGSVEINCTKFVVNGQTMTIQ